MSTSNAPVTGVERAHLFSHLRLSGQMVSAHTGGARSSRRMIEAERLFNKPWTISRSALTALVAEFTIAAAVVSVDQDGEDDFCPYLMTEDGIACIPVVGPLTKARYWRGTSYGDVALMVSHALENGNVKAILLCFDSPGGEVSGMFELADYLATVRGQKPFAGISDDDCYSAAYCLAATTERIFVTRTGGTGSVGCWMAHVDYSGMLSQEGVKVTYIFAGKKKVDGNSTEPLPDRVKADLQTECDRIREMFVQSVAQNRGVSADALMETEAGTYMAETGLPLLADQVGTVQDALTYLRGRIDTAASTDEDEAADLMQLPADDDDDREASNVTAIRPHKTATTDGAFDNDANVKRLKSNQSGAYYKKAFAWVNSRADASNKGSYKFIHHEVSSGGEVGAANVLACRAGIAVLNGARTGAKIPAADRQGVYNHLAKHMKDAGLDAPTLKTEAELAELESSDLRSLLRSNVNFGRGNSGVASAKGSFRILGIVKGDQTIPQAPEPSEHQSTIGHECQQRLLAELPALRAEYGDQVEARILHFAQSRSEAGTGRKITITAVPYGVMSSDLGGFREIYNSGCFKDGLSDDPRAVFDHDYACILGRVSAGTAKFTETDSGVQVECEAPETQWASDLLVSMRRKDITGASAAFFILKQHWEVRDGERIRFVDRALMRESSVYAFPAYESTQAQVSAPPAAEAVPAEAGANEVSGLEVTELDRARLELLTLR